MQKVKIVETELEKEQAFEIRRKVFVDEQGVALHVEMDEHDDSATHFIGYELEQPIAAARIREYEQGVGKVERVCVLPEYRGHHFGAGMMEQLEEYARSIGYFRLQLNSQSHAIPFYERLGYDVVSPEFMDAGIPHRQMEKTL
ncbi:GNAT family N-acetyltransferase [Planococcus sp. CP5-4]|uniref:GNAT family N-acetyltransferase n=1 Tax=unclassified Planococcus (in: firmicutes) TaxID=2662419 RepID=UPI001C227BF4|nr:MULTISPECIES: GNAT family N-acetyltransferase [unclassified Planococcus (in: firmicutes)]MBU9672256.1 GNAT family N-acetyltransferase [Planococcus sp. CP5-4_YE]MBV0907819.1 GNAT family N-acetyltransferase [Planococcus sp. CP5-4_UN]MBW6062986.1 GNAT family N-acetyltransferase [Planococcus sp. CP5-4]